MKILNSDLDLDRFFENVSQGSLLLLDYDGTLAPHVKDRQHAFLYSGVYEQLTALILLKKTRVIIVSGRSLEDLERLTGLLPSLELWGSHGLERKLVNGKIEKASFGTHLKEGAVQATSFCRVHFAEEFCEFKPYGVALHWRGMDPILRGEALKTIEEKWSEISARYDLELHHFDAGIEIRPKRYNKGDVVHKLLPEVSEKTAIAYLGDDQTDEEAFAVLDKRGLKVLVREQLRPTLADLHLIPPQELLSFLERWERESL